MTLEVLQPLVLKLRVASVLVCRSIPSASSYLMRFINLLLQVFPASLSLFQITFVFNSIRDWSQNMLVLDLMAIAKTISPKANISSSIPIGGAIAWNLRFSRSFQDRIWLWSPLRAKSYDVVSTQTSGVQNIQKEAVLVIDCRSVILYLPSGVLRIDLVETLLQGISCLWRNWIPLSTSQIRPRSSDSSNSSTDSILRSRVIQMNSQKRMSLKQQHSSATLQLMSLTKPLKFININNLPVIRNKLCDVNIIIAGLFKVNCMQLSKQVQNQKESVLPTDE